MDGGRERARGLCRSAGRCSTARRGTLRGHTRLPTLLRVLGVGQRVTLPALRQPVQTLSRLGAPLTVARTRWMFGSNRRLVILRDHGRLLPNPGPLAQMSQTAATVKLPQDRGRKGSGEGRTTATGYRIGHQPPKCATVDQRSATPSASVPVDSLRAAEREG